MARGNKPAISEEERFVLTPKGIAILSMLQSGLISEMNDPCFDGFWKLFELDMRNLGYLAEDNGGKSIEAL